jgi:hypothetical protein
MAQLRRLRSSHHRRIEDPRDRLPQKIVGGGIGGGTVEQNLADMEVKPTSISG